MSQATQQALTPLETNLLRRIESLNHQGVIARAKDFEDIGDEELVRHQLSNLIRGNFIDGGLGSIIQLTPRGAEELRLHDKSVSGSS